MEKEIKPPGTEERKEKVPEIILPAAIEQVLAPPRLPDQERLNWLETKVRGLLQDNSKLRELAFETVNSTGTETRRQYIPVEIYLDTSDGIVTSVVFWELEHVLNQFGFEAHLQLDAVYGSWFKRLLLRSKEAITSEEVTNRLRALEYGLEVNAILHKQSEINKNDAEAIMNLSKALETVENAAIRVGSLVLVKTTVNGVANMQVRTLGVHELHILNKQPDLLTNPQSLVKALFNEVRVDDRPAELQA